MEDKTRMGLSILGGALGLGLGGNWLFNGASWGLNLWVWAALTGAAAIALVRLARQGAWPAAPWGMAAALGFALAIAWRDSAWLRALDALVLAVCVTLPFWLPSSGRIGLTHPGEALAGAKRAAGASAIGGSFMFGSDMRWQDLGGRGAWRHGRRVLTGALIALPLLLVFGGLFASADARFEALVRQVVDWRIEDWLDDGFLVVAIAWGTAGYLNGVLARREAAPAVARTWPIGIVEVATVLVLLLGLFATFVALQLPYLFGGAGLVAATEGLTLAEYARRGFFELVWVTALALPLLLALHGLVSGEARRERVFRWLAGGLLGLLGVIIASAVQRMGLYQAEFGWTTARLYVLAFELWLAGVLVWFAVTVLCGRRERFVFGTLVWGLVASALLHGPNWEAMIVRQNVALAHEGRPVDAAYLANLSLDAVPALAESFSTFQGETRLLVARRLVSAYEVASEGDWRSWSWSRQAALEAVAGRQEALKALLGLGVTRPAIIVND